MFLGNEESEARNRPQARSRTVLLGASSLGGQGEDVKGGCSGGLKDAEWVAGGQGWAQSGPDDPFVGVGLRKTGRSEETGGGWGQGKCLAGPFSPAGRGMLGLTSGLV